jgi:hypothetical protein
MPSPVPVAPSNAPSATASVSRGANTLVETPDYTGVIVSQAGAEAYRYLLDRASLEFWTPALDDVSRAEMAIRQHVASVQQDPALDVDQREKLAFIVENIARYRRQYVGIVVDGGKRIWCNAFMSDSFPEWQNRPVDVDGGGNRYWQIEYSLDDGTCSDFVVHGES